MKRNKITLLFDANKEYGRQILKGIGHYLQTAQPDWDLYLEDDFRFNADNVNLWLGDGIIADFDNKQLAAKLATSVIPVVAVGGSYADAAAYSSCPYIATDNAKIIMLAFKHLQDSGIEQFAFYGMPKEQAPGWATEREKAFLKLMMAQQYPYSICREGAIDAANRQKLLSMLGDWLVALPKPVGIIAVTDAQARYLIQACQKHGLLVPDDIAIIGIDNDELAKSLSAISLSSVKQGCFNMGFQAAKVLDQRLNGQQVAATPMFISPEGVVARESSAFRLLSDPIVKQAIHYIRLNAVKRIKVTQVANHLQISRSQLENRFLAEVGHSVHQELHNQKRAHACQMLLTTEEPVSEVARLSGYSSKQYLSAVFQRHFNLTPLQYRQAKLHAVADTNGELRTILSTDQGGRARNAG